MSIMPVERFPMCQYCKLPIISGLVGAVITQVSLHCVLCSHFVLLDQSTQCDLSD
jgi:hypothetical protein